MKNADCQHISPPSNSLCAHLKVDFMTCHQKYQKPEQQQSSSGQGQSQQGAGMEEQVANLNGTATFWATRIRSVGCKRVCQEVARPAGIYTRTYITAPRLDAPKNHRGMVAAIHVPSEI